MPSKSPTTKDCEISTRVPHHLGRIFFFLTEVSNPSHSTNLPTRIFFSHVLMWVLSIVPQEGEKQGRQLQWWCSLETTQPPHMQMKPVKPSQHLSCFLKGNPVFWTFPRSFSNALPSVLTTLKNCTNIFCGAISKHIHTRYLVPQQTHTKKTLLQLTKSAGLFDTICPVEMSFIRPPLQPLHFPCFQVSLYQVSAIPKFCLFFFKGHDSRKFW